MSTNPMLCLFAFNDKQCVKCVTTEDMDSRSCGQMATKKTKVSTNDTNGTQEEYPKDSFDRFGDDLCGLVLSYLSVEDCFRFECLSKQWQRLSFKSREHFQMTNFLDKWRITRGKGVEYVNWEPLLSVIRKCANITSVCIFIDSEATERVFEILINSYKHSLNAIEVEFCFGIDLKIMDRIVCKYGSQLTAISVPQSGCEVLTKYSKSLTKLRQLSGFTGGCLLSTIITENNEILVKNLTEFHFIYTDSDWQRLRAFVDYYKNSLKSINLYFQVISAEECIRVLKLITQMKTLRELRIEIKCFNNPDTIQSIVDYHCDEFVNQWPQLKRYRINLRYVTEPQVRQLYESVNRMKRLRRLDLILTTHPNHEKSIELTSKSLSPLKRLTHLYLMLDYSQLNETFFDSIHTHLPLIETLELTLLGNGAHIEKAVANLPKLKCLNY